MLTLTEWFAAGERIKVTPAQSEHPKSVHIFTRVSGSGNWLTFLHGFPTCSWDWAKIEKPVAESHTLLLFDFLGFGDSDKPPRHNYSIFEQADITEALWRHFDITETGLVAHDYGDTVALELLSRQREGKLATHISRVVLLNGGVYVEHQRPLPIQRLLHKPVVGALISRLLNEGLFKRRFASIFSKAHPITEAELQQHWRAMTRRGGKRSYHRIGRYLVERRRHRERWEHTLEAPGIPMRFVWGLADPISGKNISDVIRRRMPEADLSELTDVGHYPQWEVPDRVTREILAFT